MIFDITAHEDLISCPYNSANFVADIGGLTGLCSGCSFLAIFELVFFTIFQYFKRKRECARIQMVGEEINRRNDRISIERLEEIARYD